MRRQSVHAERQRWERALEVYLHRCFDRATSARVSEFAASVGRSRSYLSRVFRSLFGQTPREALRVRQLAYAEELLRTTSRSTEDVARLAGFGTQMTFYRIFTALRGMTPDEYRSRLTKC
jgi:AraC-like DNA-binding protein